MSLVIPEIPADDPRWTKRGAVYVPAGEGESKWVAGDVYTVKADSARTGGRFGFVEASVPPGGGPTAHVHNSHGEAFYIVDGTLEFLNGDETINARSGDFFYVPPGIRHRFRNKGVHTTKMLFFFSPGGPEASVQVGDDAIPGKAVPEWTMERHMQGFRDSLALDIDTDSLPEKE
ncbi:cupin domain-containing protein [Streptomyces sp. NPDC090025]|uniref:cupin domain-containing protein n=1 Tax=Streptomyces sp. NPDC090025 TaxID=3365922 RepID=UPI0038327FF9